MRSLTVLFVALLMSGCEVIAEDALERTYDSKVERGSYCHTIEMSCADLDDRQYIEWQTPNGETRCQCQK